MTSSPAQARILIATDSVSDADQLTRVLREHFESLHVSSAPEAALADFEAYKPDVLVLAFDSIAKAQLYCLGLYRHVSALDQHPHRTVLLCGKDELATAFALCKQQYFDDYVLYWPLAYDGHRLPMSLWNAAREVLTLRAESPSRAELRAHSRHLQDLERTVASELSVAENQIAAAHRSMNHLEQELASASEDFSRRLLQDKAAGVEVKDSKALAREIASLQSQQLAQAQLARSMGLEPMDAWTRQLRERLTPSLEGTRPLLESVRALRVKLLVIDDDAMIRVVLTRGMDAGRYDLVFAGDGVEALRSVQRDPPDAILMDYHLPGLDGIALMQRLKSSPDLAAIPIIMMTGDSRKETVRSSIEAGAADFVVKPFTREALQAKLDKVLRR